MNKHNITYDQCIIFSIIIDILDWQVIYSILDDVVKHFSNEPFKIINYRFLKDS